MSDRKAEILDILETLHAAFGRRDMDTIARYFAEDVRFVTPDGELLGKTARIADEQRIFDTFDNTTVEVTSVVVDGDEAIEFCILHGVLKGAPSVRIDMRYVVHNRFQGRLIVEQEVCFDREALRLQLGMPAAA